MNTSVKGTSVKRILAVLAILVGVSFLSGCFVIEKKVGAVDLVFVDGGTFNFGAMTASDPGSPVTLRSYYISKYEVTFEEYDFFCVETKRPLAQDNGWGRARMPVTNVSWWDAIEFANWRSMKSNLTPAYQIDKPSAEQSTWTVSCNFLAEGYRLPTEAEFEFAAKGGNILKPENAGFTYSGAAEADAATVGWYLGNSQKQPYDVGKKSPNDLQTFDMSGNVEEWCWDYYVDKVEVARYSPTGPGSTESKRRILRGGSWNNPDVTSLRTVARSSELPGTKKDYIGFRLARGIAESVLVEGGSFTLGSTDAVDRGAQPPHGVSVKSFYMTKYEITFDDFDTFCDERGRARVSDYGFGRGRVAVVGVSWFDAVEFANWKSEKEGFTPCYSLTKSGSGDPVVTWDPKANGFRLPTEAEWEYAAKGGKKARGLVFAGTNGLTADTRLDKFAWYSFTFKEDLPANPYEPALGRPHPVTTLKEIKDMGPKKPNELGIYNLSGNVSEWCWDIYGPYDTASADNPLGAPSGDLRVIRGGSWYSGVEMLRTTFRSFGAPGATEFYNGIRLVRNAS